MTLPPTDVDVLDYGDDYDYKNVDDLKKLISQYGDGKIGNELSNLINSRHKIIYITTNEERRVMECLKLISIKEGYRLCQWDMSAGMIDVEKNVQVATAESEIHSIPQSALGWVIEQSNQDATALAENKKRKARAYVYAMFDIHHFLCGDGSAMIERLLKRFSSINSSSCIVLIAPAFNCPPGLMSEVTVVDFPFPSKHERKRSLKVLFKDLGMKFQHAIKWAKDNEEELLNSVAGLTLTECENAYAKSVVKTKRFDIPTLLEEKRQIIRKNGILEFCEPRHTFDDIGGLGTLKEWLSVRKTAFSDDAREFGIQVPKGIIISGSPGTGKSLTCEALSNYYSIPLLRLDMGSVYGSLVGQSEKNIRDAIKIATAISPCVLWLEEIDKGLSGIQSSNQTDGGTTSRVFGTLLTWLQEKREAVFVVCTANNITCIPPEFMRAGRFDEIFFVDLPNLDQRQEVIECLLLRKKRNPEEFNIKDIAIACENYSPAEIEKGINNALFVAFSDNKRPLTTDDILSEMTKFKPLYNTRKEDIEAQRKWALGEDGSGGRAVLANSPSKAIKPAPILAPQRRQFDFEEDDL